MARRKSSRRRSSNGGGNGIITGILIGMIVAVGAVAVLMWYMNNNQKSFKQPQAERHDPNEYQRPQRTSLPPQTEIIRPQDSGVTDLPPIEPPAPPPVAETPSAPETTVEVAETKKEPPKEIAKKETPKKANDDVLGEFIRKKDKEKTQVAQKPKSDSQNDDVLGNLISEIDTKNRQPEKKSTAATQPAKSVFKPIVEGKSVLQAGSFDSQEKAESQRAKLSMMGISTHIETAVRDGKTYYRVRSGSIDTDQAYALKKRLADNHTDSIVIPYR